MSLEYIITGTGRCGTGYLAQVFTGAGVPCGHEAIFGPDGLGGVVVGAPGVRAESSWLAAPFLDVPICKDATIIHLVRHPQTVIESLLRIGFFDDESEYPDYAEFAYTHLGGLRNEPTPEARAVTFYSAWNQMIEAQSKGRRYIRHRVEDDAGGLLDVLGIECGPIYDNRRYNTAGIKPVAFDLDDHPGLLGMAERYGYDRQPPAPAPRVFWAILMERAVQYTAANALFNVAMECGMNEFLRISVPYARPDAARNQIVEAFMGVPGSPDDVLVMLDCDHEHPSDIVARLVMALQRTENAGVMGALAFRRSAPYEPMFFARNETGWLRPPADFDRVIYECDAVGTGAIAIKRWVFDRLAAAGHPYFFKYEYTDGPQGWRASEDMWFAWLCEQAGIRHHVDCATETPHLGVERIDSETWFQYRAEHPEILSEPIEEIQEVVK